MNPYRYKISSAGKAGYGFLVLKKKEKICNGTRMQRTEAEETAKAICEALWLRERTV